jgi:hypothetical protein
MAGSTASKKHFCKLLIGKHMNIDMGISRECNQIDESLVLAGKWVELIRQFQVKSLNSYARLMLLAVGDPWAIYGNLISPIFARDRKNTSKFATALIKCCPALLYELDTSHRMADEVFG